MTGRPGDDFVPTTGDLVVPGRGDIFTDVGEWVVMCGISHLACRSYWVLRAHVNRSRKLPGGDADERCWPLQNDLAAMMHVAKPETVGKAIRELVDIDAVGIEVQRFHGGMRQRNVYTVHREAPAGFDGPRSVNDWYAASRPPEG